MKDKDGWVFTDENSEEIGFALPSEHDNADDAVRCFSRCSAVHFEVYFRKDGELYSCSDDTTPSDFYSEDEEEENVPSSLYDTN